MTISMQIAQEETKQVSAGQASELHSKPTNGAEALGKYIQQQQVLLLELSVHAPGMSAPMRARFRQSVQH